MKILIVDDEKKLAELVSKHLKSEGFTSDVCNDGLSAMEYLEFGEYDAVVLDIMLPGIDGLSILKKLRGAGNSVPVLLLTAKSTVEDKVSGLDLGADDYLTKPFSLEELTARLRVMIRRNGQASKTKNPQIGDLVLDQDRHIAIRSGKEIELTNKEYMILEYLIHNKGIVLSREKIENHIWNYDYEGGSNIVDVYIRTLRKKIDKDFEDKLIKTVRGVGYVIKE